jgi:hypothetical protein
MIQSLIIRNLFHTVAPFDQFGCKNSQHLAPFSSDNAIKKCPTFFLAINILNAREHIEVILRPGIRKSTDCPMVTPIHGQKYLARHVQAACIAIDNLHSQFIRAGVGRARGY